MASRYVLKFTKRGYAKYTSHLDLLRFFKRAFRKTGVTLRYSQGFNPHPKMSFAQPLSLGYSSGCEYLEFETELFHGEKELLDLLAPQMPEGMEIQWCKELKADVKSLAGAADSARYRVWIPFEMDEDLLKKKGEEYLAQEEIVTLKRQKKDKKMAPVDIKNMIRGFQTCSKEGQIVLDLHLDCGSISNCSPELVITSFCQFTDIGVPRYKMDVERLSIEFVNNLQF